MRAITGAARRPPARWAAAAVAAVAAVLLAGCASGAAAPPTGPSPGGTGGAGGGSTPPTTVLPSVDPSAAASASVAATEAEILRVYAEFMDARNVSLNDPRKPPDRRLWQVSIPPARDQLYELVIYYRSRKMAVKGDEVSMPGVPTVTDRSALVIDCVDGSKAIPVSVVSGKPLIAPNQPPRLRVDVALIDRGGKWVVRDWTLRRSDPC